MSTSSKHWSCLILGLLCVCVHMCLYLHGHRYMLSSWLLLSFCTRPYLVWWRCTVHLMLCGYSLLDSSNNPQSGPALWKSRLPCHRFTGWEVGQGLRVYAITHVSILKYLTLAYGRCIFSSSHFTEGLCNIKTISFFFSPHPSTSNDGRANKFLTSVLDEQWHLFTDAENFCSTAFHLLYTTVS